MDIPPPPSPPLQTIPCPKKRTTILVSYEIKSFAHESSTFWVMRDNVQCLWKRLGESFKASLQIDDFALQYLKESE
jgi:hypothetical protein